jgi:tRNA-dihydrouridine synthase B
MQDVTDLAFMQLLGRYGPPDLFFTEYFRVHAHSTLEKHIVAAIRDHGTGRPVIAQVIGEDLEHLRRTALQLQALPIAGVDLNMGCPAPKVYRKNVGGGLLRDLARVDGILQTLRAACAGRFSVKMRIGFDRIDMPALDALLDLINRHGVDLVSVHGRTVKEMYRSEVHYDVIAYVRQRVGCPVLANGNVTSARRAREILAETGCVGVMIGRSAIRNPWIFRQYRELLAGSPVFSPRLADVRQYVDDLWIAMATPGLPDSPLLNRMKKFLNFVGQSIDPAGAFLHDVRRVRDVPAFFAVCDHHLLADGRGALPFADEPYPGVIARPNHEAELTAACG